MSVFGVEGTAEAAARGALQAALEVWNGVDLLSRELAAELKAPLRIGIGIHVGTAVVGLVRTSETEALQFLGDTGNIAAKLEAHSKQLGCTLVASAAALRLVTSDAARIELMPIAIAGKSDPIDVAVFRSKSDLRKILSDGRS